MLPQPDVHSHVIMKMYALPTLNLKLSCSVSAESEFSSSSYKQTCIELYYAFFPSLTILVLEMSYNTCYYTFIIASFLCRSSLVLPTQDSLLSVGNHKSQIVMAPLSSLPRSPGGGGPPGVEAVGAPLSGGAAECAPHHGCH